jgi:hypothetical protein
MPLLPRGCLALTFLAAGLTVWGGQPPPEQAGAPARPAAKGEAAGTTVPADKLLLPPGAVWVLYDQVKDSLRQVPKVVLVSPEKFQQLMERLDQLQRQLRPATVTPYSCRLTGRLDGDFLILQANLKVETAQPHGLVALGFKGAFLTADPELDGQMPPLAYKAEAGYTLTVEKTGSHHLALQMKLPVAAQRLEGLAGGIEHSFEVGLPGAPVTLLSLELPRTVQEVRWNGYAEKAPGPAGKTGPWEIALGQARTLKLSWKEPALAPSGGPPLTARWQTTVQVQEGQAVTTARLTVDDLRAGSREWRITAPAGADVKVLAPEAGPYSVSAENNTTFVVRGPPAARLEVQVTVRRPRPFGRLAVGPFLLAGAGRQEGTIDVRAAPDALRGFLLTYHKQGDVRQQDLPRDQAGGDLQARIQYWAPAGGTPPRQAPLDVELKAVAAQVETSVEHVLRLRRAGENWQVGALTRIRATPLHNGVDFLEVQLPRLRPLGLPALGVLAGASWSAFPGNVAHAAWLLSEDQLWPVQVPLDYECRGEGAAAAAELQVLPGQRKARVALPHPQLQTFTVVLTAKDPAYLLPGNASAARLELPRPVSALDRGGTVRVEVDEGLELLPPLQGEEAPERPGAGPGRQQQTITSDRAPRYAELAWRPYRPEVQARLLADVTLHAEYAHVREEVEIPDHAAGTAQPLRLAAPARITGLKLIRGGRRLGQEGATLVRLEAVPGQPVILEYDFTLPPGRDDPRAGAKEPGQGRARSIRVPLLWPEQATHVETKVRVWAEPGTLPVLPESPNPAGEPWRDRGAEIVAGHDSLPALVLEGEGLNLPLRLRLLESALPPLAGVLVDRALIQVAVSEEARHYRARFLLGKLSVGHLEVEFPASGARLQPQILLDGKKAPWRWLPTNSRVAQVSVEPELYRRPVVLEITYQVPANATDTDGVFQTALRPPVLHGDVFLGRVRWQVLLPSQQVALPPRGHAAGSPHWVWRGWLLAPEPAVTDADLEEWLLGQGSGVRGQESGKGQAGGLVFWSGRAEPVTVAHLPLRLWLVLCSAGLLVIVLGLMLAPLSRPAFWVVTGALALGLVAAGLTWPAVLPVVLYGCEPAAVVLVALLAVQWLLQRRYRRRVVFMPGFTRVKTGSSLVRAGGAAQRPREVSTVDAPATPAASAGKSAGSSAKEIAP